MKLYFKNEISEYLFDNIYNTFDSIEYKEIIEWVDTEKQYSEVMVDTSDIYHDLFMNKNAELQFLVDMLTVEWFKLEYDRSDMKYYLI
jgi:hypothetical protein